MNASAQEYPSRFLPVDVHTRASLHSLDVAAKMDGSLNVWEEVPGAGDAVRFRHGMSDRFRAWIEAAVRNSYDVGYRVGQTQAGTLMHLLVGVAIGAGGAAFWFAVLS